jgi:hypothetical protein
VAIPQRPIEEPNMTSKPLNGRSLERLGAVPLIVVLASSLAVAAANAADPPAAPKVSSYAPVKDLAQQVEYFIGRIEDDLRDPTAYSDDHKGRIAKDASTLAVVALALGLHDEKNEFKSAAPAMMAASRRLAADAKDYAKAKAGFEELKKVMASPPPAAGSLKWQPVGELVLLMQQVPIVNNNLRRGVEGRRFSTTIDANAGLAATLAVIAEASSYNTDYCEDAKAEAKWRKICADMRDAAATVNVAIRKGDQETAKTGLAKLVTTCDACHHEFRDP